MIKNHRCFFSRQNEGFYKKNPNFVVLGTFPAWKKRARHNTNAKSLFSALSLLPLSANSAFFHGVHIWFQILFVLIQITKIILKKWQNMYRKQVWNNFFAMTCSVMQLGPLLFSFLKFDVFSPITVGIFNWYGQHF